MRVAFWTCGCLIVCAASLVGGCTTSRKPFVGCVAGFDVCNGLDDDCDGRVDENSGEVCNDADDDCDGNIDEGQDLPDDPFNCGGCGNTCELPHAESTCGDGVCLPVRCEEGYSNTDALPENGCEQECLELEICNQFDDDCDGDVDEDAVGDGCAPGIQQVAAGGEHTCALRNDGHVFCWGEGEWGQLGHGRNNDRATPGEVSGLEDVLQIGTGGRHTCALRANGDMVCWGNNQWGQLGTGRLENGENTPQTLELERVSAIGIGSYHSCMIDTDGDVWCWGWNGEGQVGRTVRKDEDYERTPAVVAGVEDAVALDGGNAFTCALLKDKTVSCWGSNRVGQLGDGTLISRFEPGLVRTLEGDPFENAIALAVGPYHACVMQSAGDSGEGTVLCWGDEIIADALHDPNGSSVTIPTTTGIADATDIAGGVDYACASRRDGSITCWGMNGRGQLGNGTQVAARSRPVQVSGVTNATALSEDHGGYHLCALNEDLSVVCWGWNEFGQLGIGERSLEPAVVPARVHGI